MSRYEGHYRTMSICRRDELGKCDHEVYPCIYHIEIETPGFYRCTLYGLEETSLIVRSQDWPKFYPPYSDLAIDRTTGGQ